MRSILKHQSNRSLTFAALQNRAAGAIIHVAISGLWFGRSYLRRRLLATTVTLESAIAAEATTGESRPNAATGMATAL